MSEKKPQPSHQALKSIKQQKANELLPQQTLLHFIASMNPQLEIEKDVLLFLQEMIDEFVTESIEEMAQYARHRGDNTVDMKDAKLFYERKFHHSVPAILSIIRDIHNPSDIIFKSIKKDKQPTTSYLNYLQDVKKSKK